MKYDYAIVNGEIITSDSKYKSNVYIKDGKIECISNENNLEAEKVIDAKGRCILPGIIDTHIHSRDGGATEKEDFYHSTMAAAAGGVTTVFEMPNTNPPVKDTETFNRQLENLSSKANVNFGLWGLSLGDINNHHLKELNKLGVVGFKYFWGYAINKDNYQLIYNYNENMENIIPPLDDGEVYNLFKKVKETGNILAIHAENSELINFLAKQEKSEEFTYNQALSRRPALAELLTIQTAISLAKETGVKLHVLHVTSKDSVEAIYEAQKDGVNITCETCPHYLFLTNENYEEIGPMMKVYPLVKRKEDQESLWNGIQNGTITVISSDHAPHRESEKKVDFDSAPAGMCGVQTLLPLMLNACNEEKLSINDIVKLLSTNPAKLYGIYPQKGDIQVGSDADITIVDIKKRFTIKKEDLKSKSKVTAYDGWDLTGKPIITMVNGNIVMNDDVLNENLFGQFVKPIV